MKRFLWILLLLIPCQLMAQVIFFGGYIVGGAPATPVPLARSDNFQWHHHDMGVEDSTTLTLIATVPTLGNYRGAFVTIGGANYSAFSVSSVKRKDSGLDLSATQQVSHTNSTYMQAAIYGFTDSQLPANGSPIFIQVTFSSSVNDVTVGVDFYEGVDQSTMMDASGTHDNNGWYSTGDITVGSTTTRWDWTTNSSDAYVTGRIKPADGTSTNLYLDCIVVGDAGTSLVPFEGQTLILDNETGLDYKCGVSRK